MEHELGQHKADRLEEQSPTAVGERRSGFTKMPTELKGQVMQNVHEPQVLVNCKTGELTCAPATSELHRASRELVAIGHRSAQPLVCVRLDRNIDPDHLALVAPVFELAQPGFENAGSPPRCVAEVSVEQARLTRPWLQGCWSLSREVIVLLQDAEAFLMLLGGIQPRDFPRGVDGLPASEASRHRATYKMTYRIEAKVWLGNQVRPERRENDDPDRAHVRVATRRLTRAARYIQSDQDATTLEFYHCTTTDTRDLKELEAARKVASSALEHIEDWLKLATAVANRVETLYDVDGGISIPSLIKALQDTIIRGAGLGRLLNKDGFWKPKVLKVCLRLAFNAFSLSSRSDYWEVEPDTRYTELTTHELCESTMCPCQVIAVLGYDLDKAAPPQVASDCWDFARLARATSHDLRGGYLTPPDDDRDGAPTQSQLHGIRTRLGALQSITEERSTLAHQYVQHDLDVIDHALEHGLTAVRERFGRANDGRSRFDEDCDEWTKTLGASCSLASKSIILIDEKDTLRQGVQSRYSGRKHKAPVRGHIALDADLFAMELDERREVEPGEIE